MNKTRITLAMTVLLATFAATQGDDFVRIDGKTNLLANPGFETPTGSGSRPEDWYFDQPGPDTLGWELEYVDDPGQAHSGNRCFRMSNVYSRGYWDDRTFIYSSNAPLDRTKKYVGRIWYRTQDVRAGRVIARIKYYNSLGEWPARADRFMRLDPAEDGWVPFDFPLEPPNEAYPYDTESFRFQVYLDHSPGTLWLDDCGVYELTSEEWQTLYPFGRYAPPEIVTAGELPTFPPANTITVRQDGQGVWWFVQPDGTPFYYTATGLGVSENEDLEAYIQDVLGMTLWEYREQTKFRAGQDLQFNSHISEVLGGDSVNYIDWLNFSTEATLPGTDWVLQYRDGGAYGGPGHYFPDPFNPTWQAYAVNEAGLIEDWLVERPQVIGYYTDNEWAYGEMSDFFWSDYCRVALVQWLQGALSVPPTFEKTTPYTAVTEVNQAWSSGYHTYAYSSFEDIYGTDKPRVRAFDDPVAADLHAFERVVLKKYTDTVIDAIRAREDELIAQLAGEDRTGYHKLIFSCRIGWDGPHPINEFFRRNGDILSAFDVIALNAYPTQRHSSDHHTRTHMETMKELFPDQTGRPVLVSEFGIAARDAGVPVRRWHDRTTHTQAERGQGYHNISATWANAPWMIGQTWFKWANGYGEPQGSDPRNCGLVNDTDQYYTGLTDHMTSTNLAIADIRRRDDFDSLAIDWRPLTLPVFESAPPQLTIIEPDGIDDEACSVYTITWTASDADSSATITLFASPAPNVAANQAPIATGLTVGVDTTFDWDLSSVAPGDYYIVGAVGDGSGPARWSESLGPLTVVPVIPGDLDCDDDVDLEDFEAFADCMLGPVVACPPGCENADLDDDEDVDLSDFAIFQAAFTGPGGRLPGGIIWAGLHSLAAPQLESSGQDDFSLYCECSGT